MKKGTKELARELYIKGFNVAKIAHILNKSEKTIKNYKAQDNVSWEEDRVKLLMLDKKKHGNNIYATFVELAYTAIDEIKNMEVDAIEKVSIISRIGDGFAKISKVANIENDKEYKYKISKNIVDKIVEFVVTNYNIDASKIIQYVASEDFYKFLETLDE